MFPSQTLFNLPNMITSNPKMVGQFSIGFFIFTYFYDIDSSQSRFWAIFTATKSFTLLTIVHIVKLISYVKMLWIYTVSNIAFMQDIFTFRNNSAQQNPGTAMGIALMFSVGLFGALESTVAIFEKCPTPQPASWSFVRPGNKSLQCRSFMPYSHTTQLTCQNGVV